MYRDSKAVHPELLFMVHSNNNNNNNREKYNFRIYSTLLLPISVMYTVLVSVVLANTIDHVCMRFIHSVGVMHVQYIHSHD